MFCSTSIFTLFPYTTLFRSAKFQVVQIPSRRMHANNAAVSQEATIIFRAENDRRLLGNSGIVGVHAAGRDLHYLKLGRSEERRVGKECKYGGTAEHIKRNNKYSRLSTHA